MLPAKRVFACLGLQLLFFTVVIAQSDLVPGKIERKFDHYKYRFHEKLFVHADRGFYVAGETMWFKMYVVDGETCKPADISKVAYLEILDKEQKPVLQGKINLEDGLGKGSFYLPLSLRSGTYTLRAYTSWMKNTGSEYYYQEPVTIVNTFLNPEVVSTAISQEYDVQFFPEGGSMVAGIRSKVAFRAVGRDGKGVDYRGVVVDQNNDTVVQLESLKFGIGHFYFTPSANVSYKAIINAGNDSIAVPLPAVREQGYVMHVDDKNSGKLEVSVTSENTNAPLYVYLLAHTRNVVKVAEAIKLQNGKAIFSFDKAELGDGISHLTIFDQDIQPVAERLYFKYPEQNLVLESNTEKDLFFARQKVDVSLSAAVNEQPVESNLSVAVYKLDSLNSEGSGNILSYLWLTSDLRGAVESPDYYFKDNDSRTIEAMDNLMLTHGWRRFQWEDVLQDRKPGLRFVPEYEGHIVSGVITEKGSGAPVPGLKTYLSVTGKLVQFYASQTNEKGEFLFVTENFYGPKEMVIQTNGADSLYNFTLNDPFSKEPSIVQLPPFDLSSAIENQLRNRHIQMQAQNMYWEDQRNKFVTPELDSVAFWGPSDKVYLLDDYTRFPTMEEVMREYVYEVRVRKENKKFKFMVFNPDLQTFYPENPLVLLDGVPVFDIDKIIALNPLKVESLEVFNGKYSLGADILFPGIINYTTYKGDLAGFRLDPNLLKMAYEGLQFQREFFSPVYEQDQLKNSRMPDFRNLLFWSPDVKTDEDGKQSLSFYTSDVAGEYIMVVQGLTKEGKAGYKAVTFKVENSL